MIDTFAVTLNPDLKQPWARLLVACSLSLLLHLALLVGIPVNPTGGAPNVVSTIYARLAPAADSEPPAPAATLSPTDKTREPDDAGEQQDPAATKAETTSEPKSTTAPQSSPSAGIDLPLIRDPTYYTPKQLDVYPAALTLNKPDCPDAAAAQRINGQVRVLLLIDEFGVVNDASVIDAQPPGYFEEVALAAFRAARFTPGQRQGHPVKVRVPSIIMGFICNPSEAAGR